MKTYMKYIFLLCCMSSVVISCVAQQQAGTLQKGRTLEEQGDYPGALENYRRMKDQEFGRISAHNLRVLYGDILETMEEINKAPKNPHTHFVLGKAYYERAGSVPEGSEIENNFGFDTTSYFSQQRTQFRARAMTALESASGMYPSANRPRVAMVQTHAMPELKPESQLQPDYEDTLLLQAKLYEETERTDKAIQTYQQLVDLPSNNPEIYYRFGSLLYKEGEPERGLALVKKSLELAPDSLEAHFSLGNVYAEEGLYEQAVTEFQETLCRDEHYTDAYHNLAQVYLGEGDFVEAERIMLLGRVHNPESLKLSIAHRSLESILDDRESKTFNDIYMQAVEEIVEGMNAYLLTGSDVEIAPELQIRYLRFLQDVTNRRRPYILACSGEEENPYFDQQIAKLEKQIDEIVQSPHQTEE